MMNTEAMKRMIQKEIHSIRNLEERVVFKELMEQVFLSLHEVNEQMYQDLEQRVLDDLAYDGKRYLIKTGIVEKHVLDRSDLMMVPMDEADLESRSYRISDMINALETDGQYRLMNVLIQSDYMELLKLWVQKPTFNGTMETEDHEIYPFTAKLRPDDRYLEHIRHLHQLFIRNGIPWQTVNAPYLYKIGNVILNDLPKTISAQARIKRIQIDFGDQSPYIRHDLVPTWNIEHINLDTVGFPVPCEDHKNYEHILSIRNYGEEHGYLVDDDIGIQSIRQREHKLYITSNVSDTKRWGICLIRNRKDKKMDHYTYPVMQNLRAKTFTEQYQRKWNESVKTKAELARFVMGFGLNEYLEYQGCMIADQLEGLPETYNMNAFIEDEIRDSKNAKILLLQFKANEHQPWLIRDVASFIVSEVQRLYPEYDCRGELL